MATTYSSRHMIHVCQQTSKYVMRVSRSVFYDLKQFGILQRSADPQGDNMRSMTMPVAKDNAIHQDEYNSVVSERQQ